MKINIKKEKKGQTEIMPLFYTAIVIVCILLLAGLFWLVFIALGPGEQVGYSIEFVKVSNDAYMVMDGLIKANNGALIQQAIKARLEGNKNDIDITSVVNYLDKFGLKTYELSIVDGQETSIVRREKGRCGANYEGYIEQGQCSHGREPVQIDNGAEGETAEGETEEGGTEPVVGWVDPDIPWEGGGTTLGYDEPATDEGALITPDVKICCKDIEEDTDIVKHCGPGSKGFCETPDNNGECSSIGRKKSRYSCAENDKICCMATEIEVLSTAEVPLVFKGILEGGSDTTAYLRLKIGV